MTKDLGESARATQEQPPLPRRLRIMVVDDDRDAVLSGAVNFGLACRYPSALPSTQLM